MGRLNEDGKKDLALTGYDGNTGKADIYFNNGDGTFTAGNVGFVQFYMGDIQAVDINNDGHIDIGLTGTDINNSADMTKIYLNDGSGNFTEMNITLPAINTGHIPFADYDGDGYKDFILNGWNNQTKLPYTKIWHNDNGTGFTETNIPFFQSWLGDIAWGDINDDGHPDLVITGTGGQNGDERRTSLHINNGDGTFTTVANTPFPGMSNSSVEIADFNNDGKKDIYLMGDADINGQLHVYSRFFMQDDSGNFSQSGSFYPLPVDYGDAKAVDYDNDGDIDLIISGSDDASHPKTRLYKNSAIAGIHHQPEIAFSVFPNPAHKTIMINMPEGNHNVHIISLTGQNILSRKCHTGSLRLNISGIQKGIYLINVDGSVKKLVIE